MTSVDRDLQSIQEARDLVRRAHAAAVAFRYASQDQVDAFVEAMARASEDAAASLAVALRQAGVGRPIVAIGGITVERVNEVVAAGAWGVAVLSGIWGEADPAAADTVFEEGGEVSQ